MSSELMSDVIECVENAIEIDRNAVVSELAMQLMHDDSFCGGAGEEAIGVEVAIDETDVATWRAAIQAVSLAVDVTKRDEAKELALRLIRALAASATKQEATTAA